MQNFIFPCLMKKKHLIVLLKMELHSTVKFLFQSVFHEQEQQTKSAQNPGKEKSLDEEEEDEDDDDDVASANLRAALKIVRDPTKSAFDYLPTGETIGAFANRHAIARYSRKIENKRERARESRKRNKRRNLT